MTDDPHKRSGEADSARQNRLREALRQNLKRRKSQARGRADQARELPTAPASGEAVNSSSEES